MSLTFLDEADRPAWSGEGCRQEYGHHCAAGERRCAVRKGTPGACHENVLQGAPYFSAWFKTG